MGIVDKMPSRAPFLRGSIFICTINKWIYWFCRYAWNRRLIFIP